MKTKHSYKSIIVWSALALICILLLSFSSFAAEVSGPGAGLPEYSSNHGGILYLGDEKNGTGAAVGAVEGNGVISDDPEQKSGDTQNAAAQTADTKNAVTQTAASSTGTQNADAQNAGTQKPLEETASTVHEGDIYVHDGVKYKKGTFQGNFKLSGYENSAGNPTYSGKMPRLNHTVAADLDVLPLGTMIIIEGTDGKTVSNYDGVYQVEDTGSGVNGNHLDIYQGSYGEAAAVTHHGWQYSDVWIAVPVE